MKKYFVCFAIFSCVSVSAQVDTIFTKQDSIRGSITKERSWWNLMKYDLKIEVVPSMQFIKGTNTISYQVLTSENRMQIDLQPPMQLLTAHQDNKALKFKRNGNAYSVFLEKTQRPGALESITLSYEGHPKVAIKAPWDGGFTWTKDKEGFDFIATSCQGEGASLWWPCKDHMYDEPENGIEMHYTVPKHLTAVGNGQLVSVQENNSTNSKTYHWKVINPINNYSVSLSLGNFVSFNEIFEGMSGPLTCSYYVLNYNLSKAKKQFKEVARTLEALEHWFGPYPFYEDGYKLVETPFLGMEHQSSVSYGNGFQNGYNGYDLSGTGWGLKFDFIIVHETGHEWFGNNITNKDIADMWIHESFTNYSESLFLEYHFGREAGNAYAIGLRKNIQNDIPVIGYYNVNNEGSGDMYYKGANMLHTIRQIIANDLEWRKLLRGLNSTFYHKVVTSEEIQSYMQTYSNTDLGPIFYQYLHTTDIPVFTYKIENNALLYRWEKCIDTFNMPIDVYINGNKSRITPSIEWNALDYKTKIDSITIDNNFYVNVQEKSN